MGCLWATKINRFLWPIGTRAHYRQIIWRNFNGHALQCLDCFDHVYSTLCVSSFTFFTLTSRFSCDCFYFGYFDTKDRFLPMRYGIQDPSNVYTAKKLKMSSVKLLNWINNLCCLHVFQFSFTNQILKCFIDIAVCV